MKNTTKKDFPILELDSTKQWERWLDKNHDRSSGVWLRIRKSVSEKKFLTYAEALDEALCYGWIDGQKKADNKQFWLQKFTPRCPRSNWSKKNTEHVERLIRAGKMKPAGLAEVDAAKGDGRWKAAYDSPSNATIPEDFLAELRKDKKAEAFFKTLNKTNLFSIAYRLQTAKKPETREKRKMAILEMMRKGQKFH